LDFAALPSLSPLDEVYLSLGTTSRRRAARAPSAPWTSTLTSPSLVRRSPPRTARRTRQRDGRGREVKHLSTTA
jgi:hypothetical protein